MKDKSLSFRVFLLPLLISAHAFAGINSSYKIQYRSAPGALNILATMAYEDILWGQLSKDKPLYGYYKLGAVLGGSPTFGAFVEVAPFAPLVFRYQKSMTYRFLKSSNFDCATVYCYGVLDRNDFSVQLGAGFGQIFAVASYLWRKLNLPESSNPVMAEQELFTGLPGEQSLNELGVTIGYLLSDERIVGLHYTSAEFSESKKQSRTAYGIFHWKWSGLDLTAGAGRYESDQTNISSNGVLFVVGKKFGDSLSLF